MNRILLAILLILLLFTGGVLLWQWNIYTDSKSDLDSKTTEADETIRMSVTDQDIKIIHEITSLPAGNYDLQNIEGKQLSCLEDKKECKITNKDKLQTTGGSIQLTYSLKKSKASAFVLNNWAVQIKDVKMNQTQVEITHYGKNVGVWVAGARNVGQTKKKNISYFVFTGNDGVFPLFYRNKGLKKVENNGFTVYGSSANAVIKAAKQYEVKTPFTFVISNNVDSFTSEFLLIRPNKDYILEVLSNRFYNKNYPFKNKQEKWLQSLIGAYVVDEEVEGKTKKLMIELSKQLSKVQQDYFASLLKENRGHDFSASYLDKLLSEVTGMESDYFIRNKSEKHLISPLYFMNHAIWYDAKEKGAAIESITMNNKRYYSLTQVTKHLGFKMERVSSTHIYLTDGSRSFRLYPGKSTFLYNEKAYSIKGELLKELNNKFYISEEYMLKIFNILIREKDNELQLINLN